MLFQWDTHITTTFEEEECEQARLNTIQMKQGNILRWCEIQRKYCVSSGFFAAVHGYKIDTKRFV